MLTDDLVAPAFADIPQPQRTVTACNTPPPLTHILSRSKTASSPWFLIYQVPGPLFSESLIHPLSRPESLMQTVLLLCGPTYCTRVRLPPPAVIMSLP